MWEPHWCYFQSLVQSHYCKLFCLYVLVQYIQYKWIFLSTFTQLIPFKEEYMRVEVRCSEQADWNSRWRDWADCVSYLCASGLAACTRCSAGWPYCTTWCSFSSCMEQSQVTCRRRLIHLTSGGSSLHSLPLFASLKLPFPFCYSHSPTLHPTCRSPPGILHFPACPSLDSLLWGFFQQNSVHYPY